MAVLNNLEAELEVLEADVSIILKMIQSRADLPIDVLEQLRGIKNIVASQEARAQMTKDALEDILSEDKDMANMNFVREESIERNISSQTNPIRTSHDQDVLPNLSCPSTRHSHSPLNLSKNAAAPNISSKPATIKIEGS